MGGFVKCGSFGGQAPSFVFDKKMIRSFLSRRLSVFLSICGACTTSFIGCSLLEGSSLLCGIFDLLCSDLIGSLLLFWCFSDNFGLLIDRVRRSWSGRLGLC